MDENDIRFMREAYKLALIADEEGEIPVGAVVVIDNKIVGKGYNQVEKLSDPTAHAEILAITAASHFLGTRYLANCALYVTLEPCTMCAGAMFWAQVSKLVYGASDTHRGFSRLQNIHGSDPVLHPKTEIVSGVMGEEASALLKRFFKRLRQG